jgi:hypothetical protein
MVQLQQGFMVGGMGQFARQQCRAACPLWVDAVEKGLAIFGEQ